jgi:hypothetical protein
MAPEPFQPSTESTMNPMPHHKHVLLSLAALVAGCSSVPVQPVKQPPQGARAQVVVFRENALAASLVPLSVGAGGKAFASLGNDEKVAVDLPPGAVEVFVQARSAEPTRVRLNLQKDATVCLRTSANPNAFAKALVPISLMATGYHFYLDEVTCPAAPELAKYKNIAVTYE